LELVLAETLAEARRLDLPPPDHDAGAGSGAEAGGGASGAAPGGPSPVEQALSAAIDDLVATIGRAPLPQGLTDADALDADRLYDRAADYVRAGQPAAALTALLVLNATPNAKARAARGLATLALRCSRDDAALLLAEQGLAMAPGHPRDSLVAGLIELQRNHRRAAQAHLAAAARNARRRPEYREDLRLAQRALLLLHLS
jgi:hypothetical protein